MIKIIAKTVLYYRFDVLSAFSRVIKVCIRACPSLKQKFAAPHAYFSQDKKSAIFIPGDCHGMDSGENIHCF